MVDTMESNMHYWPTVLASGQYEEMKQFHWSRALDDGRKPEPYCPRVLSDVKMVAFVTNSYAKTDSFIVSFIYLLFFLVSQ